MTSTLERSRVVDVVAGEAKRRVKWWAIGAGGAIGVVLSPILLLLLLVGGGGSMTGESCGSGGNVAAVLATIRQLESGNNYEVRSATSTASGAYQFIDSTWASYGGYPRAWLAPPEVQDARAEEDVRRVLTANHGDVATVPVSWYYPLALTDPSWMDRVPAPEHGNTLTVREYQTKWLAMYAQKQAELGDGDETAPCGAGGGEGAYPIPDGVTRLRAGQISWGGFANGWIAYDAMRFSKKSGYLYPTASIAWDEMAAAAEAEGFDIKGSGYRSYESQVDLNPNGNNPAAAKPGNSNHGWALAVDVAVLVPGGGIGASHPGYGRPEYAWLAENGPRWGWCHPDWADPVNGGGPLEPWHFEWCAFMGPAGNFGHG